MAAPAVTIPKNAVFWADYLTRMHSSCTPQMLAPFLGTDHVGAAKVHAEMVAQNLLTHSGQSSGSLRASQPNNPVQRASRQTGQATKQPKSQTKAAQTMPETKLNLRPAIFDDCSKLAEIWHDGWHRAHAAHVPETLTSLRTVPDFYRRLSEDISNVVCAEAGGKVIGFVITRKDEIYQLYVSRNAQGTGAAGSLITAGEDKISNDGYKSAFLDCLPENDRARAFYTKMGWIAGETRAAPLDTSDGIFNLNCIVFRKTLTSEG